MDDLRADLREAINMLLDAAGPDLVRFAWGKKGFVFQESLPPMSVFDGRLVVPHLHQVKTKQEVGLVHLEVHALPDPEIPERIYSQGSGVFCETHLPVLSTLYWLDKTNPPPQSPHEWIFQGKPTMQWFFETINIPALSAFDLLNTELIGLVPLVPFTRDATREIMGKVMDELPAEHSKQADKVRSLLLIFGMLAVVLDKQFGS